MGRHAFYRVTDPLFDAYVDGLRWVLKRLMPPFRRLVRRWHSGLARKVNGWTDNESLYFEYDEFSNTYIIATPSDETDPGAYEMGHTAGKAAVFLGAIPVVLALVFIEVVSASAEYLPVHWAVSLAVVTLLFGTALFAVSAVGHLITISVEVRQSQVPQ